MHNTSMIHPKTFILVALCFGITQQAGAITAWEYIAIKDHGKSDTKAAIEFYANGLIDGINIALIAMPSEKKLVCLDATLKTGEVAERIAPRIRKISKEFPQGLLPDATIAALLQEFPCK